MGVKERARISIDDRAARLTDVSQSDPGVHHRCQSHS